MENQLNLKAFWNLSYGLYIVSTCHNGKLNGQISNTVFQVTDKPPQVVVSINKSELTHDYIMESKHFAISILEESTPLNLIGLFGFKSGREIDKLSQVQYKEGITGCPLVLENAIAILESKVINTVDVGSHTLFIGEVVYAEMLKQANPMTYAYYHQVKGGKSPEQSPISKIKDSKPKTHNKPENNETEYVCYKDKNYCVPKEETKGNKEMKKYVCDVCGYVYDPAIGDPDSGISAGTAFEDIPDSWKCPVCGVDKDQFSPQ